MEIDSGNREFERRRRNLIILGVILCVAWLMPALKQPPRRAWHGATLDFSSLTVLFDSGASSLAMAQSLLPGLIGVAVIILATRRYSQLRGVVLIVLPVTMLMLSLGVAVGPNGSLLGIFDDPESSGLLALLGLLALSGICILTGLRVESYRSGLTYGAPLAAFGAVLFMAAILIPVMPREMGVDIYLELPFKLLQHDNFDINLTGLYMALELGLVLGVCLCSVFAVLARKQRYGSSRYPWCEMAFWFLVISRIFGVLANMKASARGSSGHETVAYVNQTKALLTGGVIGLLFIAGFVDMIVGPEHQAPQQPPAEPETGGTTS